MLKKITGWIVLQYHKIRVLKTCRRFRRLLSHSRRLKIYQACVFQQFLCLCELSLSRFVDLVYLLIDYFYYCNLPNTNKSTIFLIYLTLGDITLGTPDILLHNISDFSWFYYIDARSVPSGVFAHEGCAVITFQKLGYPYMERKNKQGNR